MLVSFPTARVPSQPHLADGAVHRVVKTSEVLLAAFWVRKVQRFSHKNIERRERVTYD
jgi:hypothetical protein